MPQSGDESPHSKMKDYESARLAHRAVRATSATKAAASHCTGLDERGLSGVMLLELPSRAESLGAGAERLSSAARDSLDAVALRVASGCWG